VCDDDVTFVPGSRLEIQPNAVVRIAPGADLTIMGNFKAQGEEDNMFWVTSNAGFENDELLMFNSKLEENYVPKNNSKLRIKNLKLIGDSLALYNSMELSDIATVVDDLIEWGKWDWGNTCLFNKVNNVTMQNGIFRNGSCGFSSSEVNLVNCEKLSLSNFSNESTGAIYIDGYVGGTINNNFIFNSNKGIRIKTHSSPILSNNKILNCEFGVFVKYFSYPEILHNDIENCELAIHIEYYSYPEIESNNISCTKGISFDAIPQEIECHYNNLNCTITAIEIVLNPPEPAININAEDNYYYTIDELQIKSLIIDKNDYSIENQQYVGVINYSPFLINRNENAGVQ
jgi:parallel beta-helix repeat protein